MDAYRSDPQHHERAIDTKRALAEGTASRVIPWPCLHEFLAIATHLRIFDPPTRVVHDARIAAICIAAGVTGLLTSDRDFSRFSALRARNPFD